MLPKMVATQKITGTATNDCMISREEGRYGLIISGKTDGAPMKRSNARIEMASDSIM